MTEPQPEDALDPDLVKLLGSIGKPKEVAAEPPPVLKSKPVPKMAAPAPILVQYVAKDPETLPIIDKPPIIEPILLDPVRIESSAIKPMIFEKPVETDQIGLRQMLTQFGKSVDQILKDVDSDRTQIEGAIIFFETTVRGAQDRKGITPYVDGWARLLMTKAEINVSKATVLDSIAKLIAAGKSNELIINLGDVKKGDLDLEKLLSQPPKEDEQR